MKKFFEPYFQAILAADKAAREVSRPSDDGGTCNLDSMIVDFKGWREKDVQELSKQTGLYISGPLSGWHKGFRFVDVACVGQGNNRTRMIEAAKKAFNDAMLIIFQPAKDEVLPGASIYYQMD